MKYTNVEDFTSNEVISQVIAHPLQIPLVARVGKNVQVEYVAA